MRTNRKTDEKKMSMNKNIARLAVTAGLTAALSFGGVMAPVTIAFAAEGDNSITISQVTGNESTKFKAYQIFKADVVDPTEAGATDKIISNVKWAFDDQEIQKAIIDAINGCHLNTLNSNASAQDVADWLTANAKNTTKETRVDRDSVLNKIAKVVKDKVTPTGNPFNAGTAFEPKNADNTPNTGYYLFLTDDTGIGQSTDNKKNTGTSPIFAVVGGRPVVVAEKTSIPTVDKQVREGDAWEKVSDSQIGEKINYKLIGTVADNIDTFATYKYEFKDHLSVGLEADKDSVAVTIDGKTVQPADNYSVQVTDTKDEFNKVTGHDLTISFIDLKAAAKASNVDLTRQSKVVVTYKARLTSDAEYTATGNTNEVKLVYSNNPMTSDTGTSTPKEVTDYVFGLDITKVEEGNQDKKLVAGFKVKVVNNGDSESAGKWLKNDGTLVRTEEEASEFMTDNANGKVFIPGLVAGTYEITETTTPSSYNTIAPFQIIVTPTYNESGKLTELDVSENVEEVTPGTANGSVVPITIENKKSSGLPLTGLDGVTFTWIAGGAVLCIGVAHLIRSRKQAEESEQE
ncbi:MAG: isopeptide-forming domain-containing fimbrial protein [Collinsella sp.]|nr:isopeptide-forming domain-containing fimbrial protein [Collinsella sp.]